MGFLAAVRALLAVVGIRELVKVLRRGREARAKPLSRSERLEHRGVAAILLAFVILIAYLVAPTLIANHTVVAGLLYGAILVGVAGLLLFAASGLVEGLEIDGDKPSPPEPPRNEPCPCGSGKKFKYCHGAPVRAA